FGAAEILGDTDSETLWKGVRDAAPLAAGERVIWRVSLAPTAAPAFLGAVRAALDVDYFLDWGGGLVWLAGPATEAAHQAVCQAASAQGGTWVLFRGPEPLRAAVAVIPPEPPPLARIARQVKAAFDPRGILNPGRMYAGL
ncbi:MAG: FAD-linked oxidase C-terminal domain-containing protein, partial [Acetobacteraceae bacterium]